MEQKKFRLKLNLFDAIVLILALAAAAVLLWSALRPSPAPASEDAGSAGTVRYTIRFQRCVPGTGDAIREGSRLTESVRNYELGRVLSAETVPAQGVRLDQINRRYAMITMEGYEDVVVEVESPCTVTEEAVTLSDGYALRVGANIFVQGDGFLATGYVTDIEREG